LLRRNASYAGFTFYYAFLLTVFRLECEQAIAPIPVMTAKEQLFQEFPDLTEDLACQVLAFLRSLKSQPPTSPPLAELSQPAPSEAELLRHINLGFSADWWTTYRGLIAERQAETIGEVDLARLVGMSEALEAANVIRVEALAKLAAIRGCPIEQVMAALGIGLA
jgi:hypothetical protein